MTSHGAEPADREPAAVAAHCLELLRSVRGTVATAESLTAGLIASTLASVPGASDALRGGLVAYATDVKTSVLGVDPALVAKYGVVSAECARAMAVRALDLFQVSWAVSATGVAGPDRQEGKPVGTVFIGLAGRGVVRVHGVMLAGGRNDTRRAATLEALDMLARALTDSSAGR